MIPVSLSYSLNVPSRLKGIETLVLLVMLARHGGLNVPSRLKGIETVTSLYSCLLFHSSCLNVPSRLKGIETFVQVEFVLGAKDVV